MLYDLRSSRPLLVKDHYYGLPIHSLHFHKHMDLVISADSKIIKMWHRDNVSTTPTLSISIPISTWGWLTGLQLDYVQNKSSSFQGKVFSSIEPQANINDVCVYPESGEQLHHIICLRWGCLNCLIAGKCYFLNYTTTLMWILVYRHFYQSANTDHGKLRTIMTTGYR